MEEAILGLQPVTVSAHWKELTEVEKEERHPENARQKYVFNLLDKVNAFEGDELSVQDLVDQEMTRGSTITGTSAAEKRGIALEVPEWNADFCLQCNECAFVCPHAAIRPFLADQDEWNRAPEGFKVMDYKNLDGRSYRIQVSVEDCTGCGLCVEACPKKRAGIENDAL